MKIGNEMRRARERAGISVKELAEKAQIGYTTLLDIEKGRSELTKYTLIRIADVLDISIDEYIGRKSRGKDAPVKGTLPKTKDVERLEERF